MAKRYWIARWSMGYAGTDDYEKVDLYDMYDKDVVDNEMTDEAARDIIEEIAYENAVQMIESYAEEDEGRSE